MTSLQDLQFPIDKAIFAAALECIPAEWSRVHLEATAEQVDASGSVSAMSLRLDSLSQPGIALVSDELQDRVRELFLAHMKFKTQLRGIVYRYSRNADGRWLFKGDYVYT